VRRIAVFSRGAWADSYDGDLGPRRDATPLSHLQSAVERCPPEQVKRIS
jgi:hypothetical protein